MKRLSYTLVLAVVALGALAASLPAGEARGTNRGTPGSGQRSCLSTLNLSADQKTAVQSIRSTNKASRRADVEALKASEKKLRDDTARNADKSVLEQDERDKEARASKVRENARALRNQIHAVLTPEQQTRFNECAESGRGPGEQSDPPGPTP